MFLFVHSVLRTGQGAILVLFEGFWMGILPDSVTDLIAERSYGDGESYSGSRWLDSGLQFFEDVAISRYFSPGRALVAATGAGREMIALARRGYEVDGFDCCRPMVENGKRALRERNIAGRLQWAPPCEVPPLDHVYDCLIVGWNGYTYISPRARRIRFLRSLWPHLLPGAPILVSGAAMTSGRRSLLWTARVANLVRRIAFRAPVFEAGDTFPGHPRHSFTREQLERELSEAGFESRSWYRWGEFCAVVAFRLDEVPQPGHAISANLERDL